MGAGYTAPVSTEARISEIYEQKGIVSHTGLFGVTRTIAFVFGVIMVAAWLGDGRKPSSAYVGSGTVLMPSKLFVILFYNRRGPRIK